MGETAKCKGKGAIVKAILTRYLGPTNFKGSRCVATAEGGHRVSLEWDDALNPVENHQAAAKALCAKVDWHGRLVTGGLEKAYVHVFTESRLENKCAVKQKTFEV